MRSKHVLTAALAATGIAFSTASAADEPNLKETRTALQQWVELRQLISEEENNWRAEKETLEESIRLIKSEMERLDNEMKEIDERSTAAEKERAELNERNAELKKAARAVTDAIESLEQAIISMHDRLPEKLQNDIEVLYQRIPKGGIATRASTGERLQNIVGILSQVEKFNRTITLTSEIQELPDGTSAQVDTIYLGLAVGYFVDGTNKFAGILTPGPNGWTSTVSNDLAPQIRKAIQVYKNEALAEFVPLPVSIN
ncbi:MAG: DUF3450 family protein [Verrucomicrobia bacterium]|nr:MAG: DUF3450 family protein [Verrucomicrobiota bacterium]